MIAPACRHYQVKKHGKDRYGNQRYQCVLCGKTWVKQEPKPFGEMRIDRTKGAMVLEMLMEGVSIRSAVRLGGIAKGTIISLLEKVGRRAITYWATKMVNLPAMDVEADEIWGFIGCKEATRQKWCYSEEYGDCYTFVAIERSSKLILSWTVGRRTYNDATTFAYRLRGATEGRYQLTTDGYKPYASAVPAAFGGQVDFAQLVKIYGNQPEAWVGKYSPGEIIDVRMHNVCGYPDPSKVCTSYIERQNLNIRMGVRRMTRLTNAFSKKRSNHEYHMAIYFLYYNFCRPHSTLSRRVEKGGHGKPTTPAMAAGLTDCVWSISRLLDELAAC